MTIYFDDLLKLYLTKNLNLKKDTFFYKLWEKQDFGLVRTNMYFFHILNPEEFENGAPLQVEERGPYVFGQARRKDVFAASENNKTYFYYEREFYRFEPELSAPLSLNDSLTVINAPLVVTAALIRNHVDKRNFLYFDKGVVKPFNNLVIDLC